MLPEHFYFTGAGWLGYFIYVPIALLVTGLIYRLLLRRISLLVIRWPIMIITSMALITWPLWGALAISYQAENLCKEQGGLHVYKTVNTYGFLGSGGIKYWSKYGFSYIEMGLGQNKRYKITLKNGEEVREEIPKFISRYQVQTDANVRKIGQKFRRSSSRVIDRETNEVLGELVAFSIYPSRFDLIMLGLLPVEYNPWRCGEEAPAGKGEYSPATKKRLYSILDVVRETLKPEKRSSGDTQ